jgi:hypothetical protein
MPIGFASNSPHCCAGGRRTPSGMWADRSLHLFKLTNEFFDNKARKWGSMVKAASGNLNSIRSRLTDPPATRSCRLFGIANSDEAVSSVFMTPESLLGFTCRTSEPATDYAVMDQGEAYHWACAE